MSMSFSPLCTGLGPCRGEGTEKQEGKHGAVVVADCFEKGIHSPSLTKGT